jgi:dynactin-5
MTDFSVVRYFPTESFIHTSTGNIIARSTLICKPQALEIPTGRCVIADDCVLRCDLAPIQLNRYSYVDRSCVLRPSHTLDEACKFIPLTIGSHSYIGENSVIEAAIIGTGCEIGNNCVLSKRVILKDYVKVLDNTVILPDMVVPPFAIVSGNPGKIVGEQPESITTLASINAVDKYKAIHLAPADSQK